MQKAYTHHEKSAHSSVAYEAIRKGILSGEYSQGQPMMESELAEKIGVSRTPVREALRQLEAEGLITIRPRMGASVKSVTMKEFREMCEVRQSLEASAAGLAAQHRTESDLEKIRTAYEAMARLDETLAKQEREDPKLLQEVIREDIRFHMAILVAARNDLMRKEILRLHLIKSVVSGRLSSIAKIEFKTAAEKAKRDARRFESLASHRAVYEAISRGDVAAAKSSMEQHIQEVIDLSLLSMARMEGAPTSSEPTEEELAYMS